MLSSVNWTVVEHVFTIVIFVAFSLVQNNQFKQHLIALMDHHGNVVDVLTDLVNSVVEATKKNGDTTAPNNNQSTAGGAGSTGDGGASDSSQR